jgi:uncharacterized protein
MHTKSLLSLKIDQLKGDSESFSEELAPFVFDLPPDDELQAVSPMFIEGEAYVTEGFLIVSFQAKATFSVPCGFCNERFSLEITHKKQLHEVPLEEIQDSVFDLAGYAREEILLEIPYYPLCGKERCLKRKEVEKYLKKPTEEVFEESFHPFENL